MKLISLLRKLDDTTWMEVIYFDQGKIIKSYVGFSKNMRQGKIPEKALWDRVIHIRTNKSAVQVIVKSKQPSLHTQAGANDGA